LKEKVEKKVVKKAEAEEEEKQKEVFSSK